jgi:hypothetical protein
MPWPSVFFAEVARRSSSSLRMGSGLWREPMIHVIDEGMLNPWMARAHELR